MKRVWAILVCVALLAALFGCTAAEEGAKQNGDAPATTGEDTSSTGGQSESTSGENEVIKVTVLMPNAGDAYFQNKSYGYTLGEEAAESMFPGCDVQISLYDAGGYEYAEKQISQMEDAITQGVDVIVLTPCDSEALVPTVERAMEEGIVVINDDIQVNTQCTAEVREYPERSGKHVGEFIAEKLNYDGNVCLLKGPAGAALFTSRTAGIMGALEAFPGITILDEQFQADDISAGMSQVEDWISRFGKDIDAIYIHGSSQAIVAADSLKAAGFEPGEIELISYDFTAEAVDYMQQGWITGLVPCQPIKVAKLAVLYGVEAHMGIEIPSCIFTTDDFPVPDEELEYFDTSDCMAPDGWTPELS